MAQSTLRLNIDSTGAKQGADQFSSATDQVKQKATQAGSAVDRMGGRFSKVTNMSAQSRFVFQNTANQLGDIAVQASMGTNVFRVLGMQLPQLAGGFAILGGTMGVVLPILGVIAAVGFPLIAMFTSMGQKAKSAGEMLDDFSADLGDAAEHLEKTSIPLSTLDEEFGIFAASVKEARESLQELILAGLVRDLDAVGNKLSEFSGNQGIFERIKYGSERFGAASRKLQDQLGATEEQADALVEAFAALEGAFEPEDQIIAYENLRAALLELNPVTDEQKDKQLELARAALQGQEDGSKLVQMYNDLKESIDKVNNTPLNVEIPIGVPRGGRGSVLPSATDLLMMRMGGEITDKD